MNFEIKQKHRNNILMNFVLQNPEEMSQDEPDLPNVSLYVSV